MQRDAASEGLITGWLMPGASEQRAFRVRNVYDAINAQLSIGKSAIRVFGPFSGGVPIAMPCYTATVCQQCV